MSIVDHIMLIFSWVLFFFVGTLFIAHFCNRWLPKWACSRLEWHLPPTEQGFDGCSLTGRCPRCKKEVLLDSQGNWF